MHLAQLFPDTLIKSAPSENVTVPLGQTTLVNFSCSADAKFVFWVINGTPEHIFIQDNRYKDRVLIYPEVHTSSGSNISIGINITTARNNNTKIHCFAETIDRSVENSTTVTVTIAGNN